MKHLTQHLLFSAFLLSSVQAFALGLGQVQMNSKLGQPLSADIELKLSQKENIEDVKIKIADKATFDSMNIDYSFEINKLKTQLQAGTPPTISITTTKPFNEPYAELILNVKTPSQQFNRVITLLLDAPDNSDSTSVFK